MGLVNDLVMEDVLWGGGNFVLWEKRMNLVIYYWCFFIVIIGEMNVESFLEKLINLFCEC